MTTFVGSTSRMISRISTGLVARLILVALGSIVATADAPAACEHCAEARALYQGGRAKDAIQILKKELKADKSSAEAAGLLGLCFYSIDKPKDAVNAVSQFLRSSPTPELIAEVREVAAKAAQPLPANVLFELPSGMKPPLLLLYSQASYPPDAANVGLGADVVLDGVVGTDGVATDIEPRRVGDWVMKQTVGFDDAAISALKRWRFFPALRDGVPVKVRVTVLGIFQIVE